MGMEDDVHYGCEQDQMRHDDLPTHWRRLLSEIGRAIYSSAVAPDPHATFSNTAKPTARCPP
jgi:hypothetical protein